MNTLGWLGIALITFGVTFGLFAIFGKRKKGKREESRW